MHVQDNDIGIAGFGFFLGGFLGEGKERKMRAFFGFVFRDFRERKFRALFREREKGRALKRSA